MLHLSLRFIIFRVMLGPTGWVEAQSKQLQSAGTQGNVQRHRIDFGDDLLSDTDLRADPGMRLSIQTTDLQWDDVTQTFSLEFELI